MNENKVRVENEKFRLLNGVNTLANAVKSTLGAKGMVVFIKRPYMMPHVTKDGVTVAQSISLEDPVEDIACQMLKASAIKSAEEAGDGTTTTTVLAQKLFQLALDSIATEESHPVLIKEGMEIAIEDTLDYIKTKSIPIGEDLNKIKDIATISANNDEELGSLIAEAFRVVGRDGMVNYKESYTSSSFIDIKEGVSFDSGFESNHFVTDFSKDEAVHNNPKVLILDGDLELINPLGPVLNILSENTPEGQMINLVIIANKFSLNVLQTLIMNHKSDKIRMNILAVRSPYHGDNRKNVLEDLAIATGAKVITDPSGVGFEKFTYDMLGSCSKVISSKFNTQILEGKGSQEEIEARVETLKELIENTDNPEEKRFIKERISKLSKGVAFINVGGNTTVEVKEKMDRVDDAVKATKAAVEEGVVIGGGVLLRRAALHLATTKLNSVESKHLVGYKIVIEALSSPILQILSNAGVVDKEAEKVLKSIDQMSPYGENTGFDVKNNQIVDLFETGIIDPAKVSRVALESAGSVASLLITNSYTITEVENK